jgi:hypothetical protein
MTARQKNSYSFEVHRAGATLGFFTCVFVLLYVVPTCLEVLLIRYFEPASTVGILGDITAYFALYYLGFRRTAVVVYLCSKVTEITVLKMQLIAPFNLVWLSDLLPTMACGILFSWMIFFSSKEPSLLSSGTEAGKFR